MANGVRDGRIAQVPGSELVKIAAVIGERTTQTLVVSDLDLSMPAVKIKEINASVRDVNIDIITDKVIVQGIIHKQIFFVDGGEVVRHQSEDVPFSLFVDIMGAAPGMVADVKIEVEGVLFDLRNNGTLLHQKVVLNVFVKVLENRQEMLLFGDGPLALLNLVVGDDFNQIILTNQVTLPIQALKISEIRITVAQVNTDIIQDKVIVQGILHKQVFFVGIDNIARHVDEDVPFDTFFEIPGALPGMDVDVSVEVENLTKSLSADGFTLSQEITLGIFVKVTEPVQENVVLGDDILAKVDFVVGEDTKQILLTDTVPLNITAIKISDIVSRVLDIEAVIIEGKVIIRGLLHHQIFYIDINSINRHQAFDRRFALFIEIPGASAGMNARIFPRIELVKPELSADGNSLIIKAVIEFMAKVTQTIQEFLRVVSPYNGTTL